MLTDEASHKSVPPSLDLNRVSKSCLKRNEAKFPEKQKQTIPRELNRVAEKICQKKTF